MATIQAYERSMFERFVDGLLAIPGLSFFGIRDHSRFGERTPHGRDGAAPFRIRCGHVVSVGGRAVPGEHRVDLRAALSRSFLFLEHEHRGALAERQPGAAAIPGFVITSGISRRSMSMKRG